jgi:hypothetical protein
VFANADAESQPVFSVAGSSPCVCVAKGKRMTTSFWRLPPIAHDEAAELRRRSQGKAKGAKDGGEEGPRRRRSAESSPQRRRPSNLRGFVIAMSAATMQSTRAPYVPWIASSVRNDGDAPA